MSRQGDHPDGRTQTPSMTNVKHLPANGGPAFGLLGHSLTFKAEEKDTDGTLFLFEHLMPPTFSVPAHTEINNESFYVLEGTLEVEADGELYRLGPGEFLSLRPGVVHSLHNPGPGVMRTLTLCTPKSGHARFFSTLGDPIDDPSDPPAPSGPPDFERWATVGHECGIDFLPPPELDDGERV